MLHCSRIHTGAKCILHQRWGGETFHSIFTSLYLCYFSITFTKICTCILPARCLHRPGIHLGKTKYFHEKIICPNFKFIVEYSEMQFNNTLGGFFRSALCFCGSCCLFCLPLLTIIQHPLLCNCWIQIFIIWTCWSSDIIRLCWAWQAFWRSM